jgi:hypothetical protein
VTTTGSDEESVRPHYLHLVCTMLADIADLDCLSTHELVALVELLIPAHSRVLERRERVPGEPLLRLVPVQGNRTEQPSA